MKNQSTPFKNVCRAGNNAGPAFSFYLAAKQRPEELKTGVLKPFSPFDYCGLSSPQKNTATVPGPQCEAIIVPISKIRASEILGKASIIA